jgi:NAD(P)-dependent dehydrogenase (short-subunit alcohol dehydrogenase family)
MTSRGHGAIINVADSTTLRPVRHYLPYLISKSALVAASQILAVELGSSVGVNCIAPGTVLPPEKTAFSEESLLRTIPVGRPGSPGDVADLVVFLAANSDLLSGGLYVVDGGVSIADTI